MFLFCFVFLMLKDHFNKHLCVNRRVHALDCIMSNQGKMERNSKVCKEVQNDEKYS